MLTSLPGFSSARRPITPTMSIPTTPWLGKQEDSMQAAADKEMTIDLSVTKTKIRTTSQEQEDEVTITSVERSFSKLKLLKNYLRSTMTQQCLNGLTTLRIEKKLLDDTDIDHIRSDFASRNIRRNV